MASVDKRADGKWRARWREFPGGPQRTKQFARKVDAERHLVKVQHDLLTGSYVTPEALRVTLGAYIETHLARQPWRPATAAVARNALGHALAVFGDRPLGAIRPGDVQAFVTGLHLAPSTVAVVRQHLQGLLEAAVRDRLIASNPARGVKLPRATAAEVVPPTAADVAALYEAAPEWFEVAVIIGAGLGLRQAEASGLTVDRIDWLAGRSVRIDRQLVSRRRPFVLAPPKTESSMRVIPAASGVLAELGAHVGRRRRDGYVLQAADGSPIDHHRFEYTWRKTVAAAGIPAGMRFHDLRHHFASALISAGCSVKAVQKALGHSSAATTLDVYGHLWPSDGDQIRGAVDRALAPAFSPEDRLRTSTPFGSS